MARRVIIPLNKNWSFRQADDQEANFQPTARDGDCPTEIFEDLIQCGRIPLPFLLKQEIDVQWVGEKSWIYRTIFPTPELVAGQKAVLAFDGLDTYATVQLNGYEILKTEDMFIPERVDVTKLLHLAKDNVLQITFESAWLRGKRFLEEHPEHYWGCWNGDPSRLAVRKAQYHYGWDWGPTLLTCGPWRPISLEIYWSRISDLYFMTDVDESLESAEVVAKADIEGDGQDVRFVISLEGNIICAETVTVKDCHAKATFRTQRPRLWYPRKYGDQPLYVLTATVILRNVQLDTGIKKFGLRRARVIQRKLDEAPGTTFMFEINNISIFCGGSNWIPANSLITALQPSTYRKWVQMAVDSNQVMLRVWGGGIYEQQAFYEYCDELGVLVWQDFMFACGNYPGYKNFLDLVKREAIANVKLLRHHPSILIWAGNNEDYQYQETENLDYDPHDRNPENWLKGTFPARYIYEKILVDVTKDLIPQTYYHFGSPFGGKSSSDPTVGDIHQWNVWHGIQEKYQDFDKLSGRFVSEFGMEAFPNIKTIDEYLCGETGDRYAQSLTVDFHNKAAGQERRLAIYLAENLAYKLDPFEYYIYCTQLMQAECVASAYRLWKRQWKGPGHEYCSGALVWQMDDCWPGQSWSIVDHELRPKLAYYAVKRELRPISIGMKRTVTTIAADKYTRAYTKTIYKIELWICNLDLQAHRLALSIQTANIGTGETSVIKGLSRTPELPPNRTTEVLEFEIPVHQKRIDEELQTVVGAYLKGPEGKLIAYAINWPEPLKYLHLPKPKFTIDSDVDKNGPLCTFPATVDGPPNFSLRISSDVPVKGVVMEYIHEDSDEKIIFEDNGFDLMGGEPAYIQVSGMKSHRLGKLKTSCLGSPDRGENIWIC